MADKKIRIAIVHNEPTVDTPQGRRYLYEVDAEKHLALSLGANQHDGFLVDLSEVGVIEERTDVCSALEEIGYETVIFNVDQNIDRLTQFLSSEKPDLVFNLCESLGDTSVHEMHVCSLYELLGVPYTGSSPITLGLCLNKVRTKEILSYNGIPTPRFLQYSDPPTKQNGLGLSFPLILKPAFEDASIGIDVGSVVSDWEAMKNRIEHIIEEYKQPALVEEFIQGREINAAIIGNDRLEVLPLSEIDFSTLPEGIPHILSYNAKWMKGTIEYQHTVATCPAPLPKSIENAVRNLALRTYRIMGCRDYARVDIRLDRESRPFVIEVNSNPDLCDDAGFARSARMAGMDYHALIKRIVLIALLRVAGGKRGKAQRSRNEG